MTWLTNWNRRKQITVIGSTTGALSDYQLRLTVNQSSGTDSPGSVYLGGNILSNFNDLRFTKSDGSTLLNYWIESISGTSPNQTAYVWIRLAPSPDTIPASPGTYNFYIYYNNPSATAASNSTNTFNLFDDFTGTNGQAVDASKWTATWNTPYSNGNSISIQNNQVQIVARSTTYARLTYSLIKSIANFNFSSTGIWVQLYIPSPSGSPGNGGWHGYAVLTNSTGNEWSPSNQFGIYAYDSQNPHIQFVNVVNGGQTTLYDYTPSNRNLAFSIYGSTATLYEWSGSSWIQKWTGSATPNFTSGYLEIADYSDQGYALVQYADNVIIRNYVSAAPGWSTIGAEQGSVTLNISSNPSGGEIWLNTPSGTSNWTDQHVSTPTTLYVLPGASYDIMVGVGGYQQWFLTDVCTGNCTSGSIWNIVANPVLLPGSLAIYSTPSGASIYLDGSGTSSGTTAPGGTTLTNMSVGSHTIRLSLTGYIDWNGTATVNTQATTTVRAVFAGSAYITSTPTNSSIYLDNNPTSIANTPSTITNLTSSTNDGTQPTQSHTYILRLTGYTDTSGSFTATAGQTTNVPVIFPGSLYITSIPTGARIYIDEILQP